MTFTEPVTASDDAFSLTCGGAAVAFTVARQAARTYVLDPQADLPAGSSCRIAVEGDRYRDDDTNDPPDTGEDFAATFTTVGVAGLRIHDIQAASHLSPYEDDIVFKVPGVVTAVRSTGFYMQDDQPDASDATSEGIFVFTSSRPAVAVGDRVDVSGTVAEFRAGCEPTCAESNSAFDNLTITELERPTVYPAGTATPIAPTLVGAGGYEPPLQVTEDDALGNVEVGNVLFDPEEDGLDWHESLEGMLVEIDDARGRPACRTSFGELPIVVRRRRRAAHAARRRGDPGGRHQPRAVHPRGRPRADPDRPGRRHARLVRRRHRRLRRSATTILPDERADGHDRRPPARGHRARSGPTSSRSRSMNVENLDAARPAGQVRRAGRDRRRQPPQPGHPGRGGDPGQRRRRPRRRRPTRA